MSNSEVEGSDSGNPGVEEKEHSLAVIGLGFTVSHITQEAVRELERAEVILGHESLISAYSSFIPDKALLISDKDIREKTHDIESLRISRTKEAIKYASQGKRVAYLCPGDPGIYSYAQPILEYCGEKVRVKIIPGITAALVAAAELGAPLRDGFALIGLNDERIDPKTVEKKVEAAITSDFVIVFYLPKHEALLYPEFYPRDKYPELYPLEKKCTERLENAFRRLLEVRSPQTPVGILHIQKENKTISTTLKEYKNVFEDIHPYSTVIVGNSMSKSVGKYFVTSSWRH